MPATVLSFSKSGLSVADFVADAQVNKRTFSPAWTVVQVHENDFTSDAWDTSKTHFRQSCDTCPIEVVRIPPVPEGTSRQIMRKLRNQFALIGFASSRLAFLQLGITMGSKQPIPNERKSLTQAAVEHRVREELRMMADAYDGRLTVLLLGTFDPAHPVLDTEGETIIKKAARELGVSLAYSKDEYSALAERGIAPHGFPNTTFSQGHLNEAGHAAAARVLTRELLRLHQEGRL
jgi:hypothetical protein